MSDMNPRKRRYDDGDDNEKNKKNSNNIRGNRSNRTSSIALVVAAMLAISAVTTASTMTSPAAAAVVDEELKKKVCLVASTDTQVKIGGTLGEKLETKYPEKDADVTNNDIFVIAIHTGQTLCLQIAAEFTLDEERGEIVLQTDGEVQVFVDAELLFVEHLEAGETVKGVRGKYKIELIKEDT